MYENLDAIYGPGTAARFAAKTVQGPRCITWVGAVQQGGYGMFGAMTGYSRSAHRFALEAFLGRPIEQGMEVDHLCCNRACVNPAHLEEVTPFENQRRKYNRRAARYWAGPQAA